MGDRGITPLGSGRWFAIHASPRQRQHEQDARSHSLRLHTMRINANKQQSQVETANRQPQPVAQAKALRLNQPFGLADSLLQIQQIYGNRAVQRLLRTGAIQAKLAISEPGDQYEQEADQTADRVMRMPVAKNEPVNFNSPVPKHQIQRQPAVETPVAQEEPDPIGDGLSTVAENLGENNPAFSEVTEDLADQFLSLPAPISVGVPSFLGANYAFLWTMALVNPAMRRHLNDFNFGTLPGIVPQFPIKTFTYRILNPEQTQFEFDLGLDVSGLLETFNEGAFNTHISTLSLETAGRLNTEAPTGSPPVGLSSLNVNLGLFDDGLMLSGGFRQGVDPYPLLERDRHTGEGSRIMQQVPGLPDLYPGQQDIRFMLQVDFVKLYNHFNPQRTPIRSVPQQLEGDRVDRQIQRKRGGGCPSCEAGAGDLRVSQPNDAAEIEADAIADRVMRMPVGAENPTANSKTSSNSIQRKCTECVEGEEDKEQGEEEMVQRKPLANLSSMSSQNPDHVNSVISSGGRPLDHATLSYFEPRLGYELSAVRVHNDASAHQSAKAVDARAYTLGNNIVFGSGEYAPHSESGRRLIAHELAHVAQQSGPAAAGKTPVIARVALTPADVNTLADSLHDAIATATTDEELIYVALQKLERDATAITSLKTAYKTKHKTDLLADLGSRLKGQSLALAKTLLGVKGALAVSTKAPGTPTEFETVAKTINTALVGKTIDPEAVYAALLPLAHDSSKATTLKTTYATLFTNALEDDLAAKLKGADLAYSLYLLNAPGPAAAHAPTKFKAQPGPGKAPATAPPPVAGGTVKAETEVPWETTSGTKGQYGFGVGYSGALSADSRWIQFIEREISYDPKGGGKRTSLDKEITAGGGKNKYRLTTSTASPNWAVDSYSTSTPFFDDKSDAWRDATSVSIYDAPAPREADIKELFDAGHTNVTSRAHFDIYLIRDYSAIYHVEIEIVWTYLDPKDMSKRKTTRTIKSTGKASGLPAALKSALVARYPTYAYIYP